MKVVVLFSGGIDSTTCLAEAVATHGAENVTALTLFYGQRHSRELEAARDVAAHFGVDHYTKDLAFAFSMSNSPLLASSSEAIPEGSYADEQTREADGMSKTYVPFRNGLMLSYAAAIAYSLGATKILYGAHADDAAGNAYPDCSEAFYDHMNKAIYLGTGMKVSLAAPLINLNKAEVVARGVKYGAPFHLTWSCYNGGERACGKCATCVDRLNAFDANGLVDLIPYERI